MTDKFKEIREYVEANYIPVIRDETAEILFDTVRECRPRRALEIGTAIGYSGLVILSAFEGVRLHTVEIKQKYAEEALRNFEKYGFGERVKIFVCDADGLIDSLSGKFDFIFMDGPKTKYPAYYERLVGLLEKGGILLADNISMGGRVTGETPTPKGKETITDGVRKYIELALSDKRLETRLYETGDGVAVSKKL